jgi:hypothetical protein
MARQRLLYVARAGVPELDSVIIRRRRHELAVGENATALTESL